MRRSRSPRLQRREETQPEAPVYGKWEEGFDCYGQRFFRRKRLLSDDSEVEDGSETQPEEPGPEEVLEQEDWREKLDDDGWCPNLERESQRFSIEWFQVIRPELERRAFVAKAEALAPRRRPRR